MGLLAAVGKFFASVGGKIAGAWAKADTLGRINMVFMTVTTAVGVKGFLQARQMMSKGQDILANKTAAGGKIPVIYGTRRVGAQIVYMDTAQNRSKDLFVVYALAVGECDEIIPTSIEIDGNSIYDGNIYKGGGYVGSDRYGQTGYGNHKPLNTASQVGDNQYSSAGNLGTNPALRYSFVFNLHHGASSQTVDPMLSASIGSQWTTAHKLNGICYIAASFDYDKKGMYKGVPQITVQVRGKRVFDPRDSSTKWSSNPALCFLDYIQNDQYGKGLATSQINMTAIGTAADKCDTLVDQPYYNGSYQSFTWSGDTGNDYILINDNDDWWQNKIDEVVDIKDSDGNLVIDEKDIKDSSRYEFYDQTQENRLYIDDTLQEDYTNEAGTIRGRTKRFHCNGYIDTNKNVMDNAKELLANMRGIFTYIDGKYELQIEDTGTSTFSITDDHIIGNAGISVDYGNKDKRANKVVIEFFNANKKYELDTATVLHDATPEYYSDDGEILEVKAEFPYVTDPYIAYNMGKAILTRSRNQTTMQFLGTPEMYKLNVGDIVDLTYLPLNFNVKICRVEALELQANGLVAVSLIEYFDVYTWEVPAQEPTTIIIKPPTIGAIHPPEANSIVFTDTDASPINRPTLTWTEPTDFPVRQYRVDVEDTANPPVQVFSKLVDTNSVDLSFLPVGNYNANITSFNGVGIESNAVVKSFTIGNPPTATADIQDDAVVTDKITDDAITTPKILDDAVTDAKINSLTANKITAGTIDASVITVTNLDADNITSGSIGADKITVDDLSAINSDLGDIDAGSLNIGSGAFVVTTAGAMTATSADVVGNLQTGNLVVTGDAGIHGEVRATSITAETVTVESIKQEVWNEIDRRTAPAQNGFYDDFSSTGTDGYYVGAAKNFDLLGTNDNGYQINSKDIDLRAGMVTGFATSTNYTGTALEATFQYFYKLASGSTWTALTPTYVGTTDKYTTPDGYFYELDADPSHRINSGTLTAESYYHFRLTVTPTVTNNVWTDSDAGSGYKVEYGVQQSSTGTGVGTGTVTSITASNGITASPTTITTTGSLSLDSTVVRTTGTQTLGGNKTFSDNVVIQGNLDVQGTTTTIDTTNLDVKDKNITLNYGTGDTSANANGAGITIQDAVSATQDATLTWNTANDSFNFSHNLNFADNIKAQFGTGNDFGIKHDGSHTYLQNSTGHVYFQQLADDSRIVFQSDNGSGGVATYFFIDGDQQNTNFQKDAVFADSIKATFGSSNDLQIYHDGTHSYIDEVGTGGLNIRSNGGRIALQKNDGTFMIEAINNGNVVLYSNGQERLRANGTGIDVTGTVVADGITSSQNITVNSASGSVDARLAFNNSVKNAWIGIPSWDDDSLRIYGTSPTTGNTNEPAAMYRDGAWSFWTDYNNTSGNGSTSAALFISTGGSLNVGRGDIQINGTTVIDSSRNLANIGTITNSAFTIPNSIGSAGQVLKVPSTGTTLEWGADTGLITGITNFADNRILTASGSTTINGEADLTWNDVRLAFDSGGGSSGSLGAGGVVGSLSSDVILTSTNRLILGQGGYGRIYISGSDINVSGNLEIGGVQVINSARNMTNIGTITSTGLVKIDANNTVNPLHIHDDSTTGHPGMFVTNTGNYATSTQSLYAKQYNSAVSATLFGQSVGGKGFIGTEGSASSGLLIGTITADSVWIGTNNTAALTINTSQNATFAGTISSGAIDVTGTVTADGLTVDGTIDVNTTSITGIAIDSTNNGSQISFESIVSSVPWNVGISGDTTEDFIVYQSGSGSGAIKLYTDGDTRLQIANNGDISFYEDTGTTAKLFWDASAESLGLGTTSPDAPLHISAATEPYIRIENTDTILTEGQVVGGLAFEQNDSTSGGTGITGRIQMRSADRPDNGSYFGNVADMDFLVSGASTGVASDNATKTAMTIRAGTGSVGIGETNIDAKLHLTTASAGLINQKFESAGNAAWRLGIPASQTYFAFDNANDNLSSPKVVIDASGNLLVGKTSASTATVGVEAQPIGLIKATRNGSQAITLNRLTSDGDIAVFKKDGTDVGSIGTQSARLTIGTGDTGLRFVADANQITPWNLTTNGVSNGLLDLGNTNNKFKDLYLSGNISSGAITSSGTLKSTNATGLILDTGASYRDVQFVLTGNTGNGTLEIIPMTVPGSGTASFTTHFKNLSATGTTRHDLKVDGTIDSGAITSTSSITGRTGAFTGQNGTALVVNSGTTNVTATFESGDATAWINIKDSASGTYGAMLGAEGGLFRLRANNNDSGTDLTVDTSGNLGVSGAITSTGYITASSANGGVSLTHNDGYGNANVTFNHRSGVPEQNGQAARIAVNTDGTGTQGIIEFEVSASDVTSGTSVNLTTAMVLAHDFVEIPQYIYHYNDTDTYLRFSNDRVRLFAGGASVFDGSGQDIRLGNKVQIGDTVSQNAFGFLQVNQEANNDESGIAILDSTDTRSMRLWVDGSNSYINSGNGGAAPLILNEAITVSSGGNLTGVGTISSSNITVNDNAEIRLSELASNGSNYVAIKSPSSLGVNTTYQLPSTYPANSGAVLIATTAGELSWSSNTVSSYTNGAIGSGRIITSNGASSIEAETNLTYDNTTLKIANAGAVVEIGNATAVQPILRLKTGTNGVPRIVFNDGVDQAYIQYGHGSLAGEKLTISSGATEFTGTITSLVNANRFFKYRSGSIADFEVSSDNNSNSVMTVTGTGTADIFKVRDNTNDVFTIADGGNATFAGDVSLSTGDLAVEGTIELGNNYIIPNTNGTAGQVLKYPTAGSSTLVWSDIDTGAVTSISNNANNRILTATGGTTINGESGLTFDGATLGVVGDISLGDNKKLYLGTGDDVEFFFDGSQAILTSPDAHLCGSSGVRLATGFGVGQQTYLDADYDNGVRLYHEGSLKAQTQDDGFKVTGEIRGTQFAYSYYNSTSTTLTTSYAVVNLDTLQASTGISGIAVASNVVTISRSGTFMITMDVVTDVTSGAARSESEAQLYKNGSAVTGTFVGMYNRTNARGLSTGSATTMISVTSGDTFEIRAKKTGTDTVVTSVGGTRLTFLQVG